MTIELKGEIGTQFSTTTRTQEADDGRFITIKTGLKNIIHYGKNRLCLIEDKTDRTPPEAEFTLDYLTKSEEVVVVQADTEASAADLGLPGELGIIKVQQFTE